MNNTTSIVMAVIAAIVFGWLWKAGHLMRFRVYVQETSEELRKCNWPSWAELQGSTAVVIVSVLLIGLFTIVVDMVLVTLVQKLLLKL